jgi:hypothetical protein
MLFKKRKTKKRETRRPDEVGSFGSVGAAIWFNDDGDHETKFGPAVTIGKELYVKGQTPASLLRPHVEAIRTVSEIIANKKEADVPGEIREDLELLAWQLDVALNSHPSAAAEKGNGLFA